MHSLPANPEPLLRHCTANGAPDGSVPPWTRLRNRSRRYEGRVEILQGASAGIVNEQPDFAVRCVLHRCPSR